MKLYSISSLKSVRRSVGLPYSVARRWCLSTASGMNGLKPCVLYEIFLLLMVF